MLRKLTKYILPFALSLPLFSAGGCVDTLDTPDAPQRGAGMITLTLRNGEGQTRANDDTNNESLIKNAFVALYRNSGDETQQPDVYQYFDGIDATKTTTVSINITDELRASLFGNTSGNSCRMYVVCNVAEDALPEDVSISSLKSLQVSSAFATRKVQESFVMAGEGRVTYTQTGDEDSAAGSATVNRAAAKITLNIKLPASVQVGDEGNTETWYPMTGSGNIRVLLDNGVQNCVTTPTATWQPTNEADYFNIATSNTDVVRTMTLRSGGGEYPYNIDVPIYTYPNVWTNSPDETRRTVLTLIVPWQRGTGSQYQSFYYQVPITNMEALVANHSYTINLNVGMLGSLTPEKPVEIQELSYQVIDWGKEDINVSMKDNRYLVVSPNIYTANNEEEITIPFYTSHPVEIYDIEMDYNRYNFIPDGTNAGTVVSFTIPKTVIDKSVATHTDAPTDSLCAYSIEKEQLNNQMLVRIKHPLMIWDPYNNRGQNIASSYTTSNLGSATQTQINNAVTTLQNSIDYYQPKVAAAGESNPILNSYSPYTIRVSIRHKDDPSYNEIITITQYPALSIEAVRNPGGSYQTGTNSTSDYAYVFVNPTWTAPTSNWWGSTPGYWTNNSNLGGVSGLSATNKNPNMYVINISSLSESDKDNYIIGDPRSEYIINDLSGNNQLANPTSDATAEASWSVQAAALYDGSSKRRLKYYYPTKESDANSDQAKIIAPKIRIASSYGVSYSRNRESMRRRCASYQEQGCPGGRWRVPTLAEFRFITTLSSKGIIPLLFNIGGTYLTAQGPYTVNEDGSVTASNSTTTSVRAVYDEWYWERETDYVLEPLTGGGYDFTWGDIPKNVSKSRQLIKKYKDTNKTK